jgi:hypothetical protein
MATRRITLTTRERMQQRLRELRCPAGTLAKLIPMSESSLSRWFSEKLVLRDAVRRTIEDALFFLTSLQEQSTLPIDFRDVRAILPLWESRRKRGLVDDQETAIAQEAESADASRRAAAG